MFKKIITASALLAVTSSIAFANSAPYMGASVAVKTNTANNTNYRGIPANLFLGFGANAGQGVYLGGEVSGTLGSVAMTDNGLKSTYGYGVSFIPGIMISDHTMGYARLGLVRSHFSPQGASSNTVSGAQFGLGLQTSLMQSWDLRGEYDYIAYNSLQGVSGSPKTDEFNLGLVYKFD